MLRGLPARVVALLLPLALVGCGDIGLDNIGDFVVTYKVTVTAKDAPKALVTLSTPDVERRGFLRSGSFTVTSFKTGLVTVWAGDPGTWNLQTEFSARQIEAKLEAGKLDAGEAKALRDELLTLHQALRGQRGPGVSCSVEVKPDPQGSNGNDLTFVVSTAADGTALIEGPGC